MPQYPKKQLAQLVIASCASFNIEHVIISPGSRNAPLTIGFTNHKSFKTYSIVDERCAAFFALGIAQQTLKPVAIVCTSGSALLNYYPAIAEAFYSDIPLVVISADRPKDRIDIGDGQTIRQPNVFDKHILVSANLGDVNDVNKKLINDALQTSILGRGPVHMNVPFDEPLYELTDKILELPAQYSKIEEEPIPVDELQKYADVWNNSSKKMVLVGTSFPDELLQIQLEKMIEDPSVIVLTETTSNLYHHQFINGIDRAIFPLSEEELSELKPEILLTFGGMVVSKRIKQFLRDHKPTHHWHVDDKKAYDTYFSLSHHFKISPQLFFSQFFFLTLTNEAEYQQKWLAIKSLRLENHKSYLADCNFSDLKVFESVLATIPKNNQLQLSNSSIVRYAQLFDLDPTLKVFCNRGTSGIDGSTSTAVGAALASEESTVFITGDVSFFYDSNALWNKNIKNNFRIILINNDGGGIFKFIPGPKQTNALSYFETPHGLDASHLCKMFGVEYRSASSLVEVSEKLSDFYQESETARLLEIKTPSELNDVLLKQYFQSLK